MSTRGKFSALLSLLAFGSGITLTVWITQRWTAMAAAPPPLEEMAAAVPVLFALPALVFLVALLGWLVSFESQRRSRPWALTFLAFFAPGFAAGVLAVEALSAFEFVTHEVPTFNAVAVGVATASGLVLASLFIGFELLNRAIWPRLATSFDKKEMAGPALLCSRVSLLFKPGESGVLRSVALARFRNGARGDVVALLRTLYDEGRKDPDILEALCKDANEREDAEAYREYIGELYRQLPGEDAIREAYLDALVESRQYAAALELIELHGVPKNADAMERFAEILVQEGHIDRATEVARELGGLEGIPFRRSQKLLREILARMNEYVPALNILAQQADRMAMREQRIRWLEKSFAADPRQTEVRSQLIDIYRELKQIVRLEQLLGEVIRENPNNRELVHEYCTILHDNGKSEEALERLVKLNGRPPLHAAALLLEARINFEAGEFDRVREIVARAPESTPDERQQNEFDALLNRVERAVLTAEVAETVDEARREPGNEDLQFEAMEKLIAGGHGDKVLAQADRILQHCPKARGRLVERFQRYATEPEVPFPVLNLLATMLAEENRFDEVLDIVRIMGARSMDKVAAVRDGTQKVLRRSPHHLATLRLLGDTYLEHARFTDMIHSYSLYLSNGGDETDEIDRALATAYFSLNDYQNARRFVKRLLESTPEDAAVLKRIATLALDANEPEEAADYVKKLELIDAKDREVRKLKERVNVGLGKRRFSFLQREFESGRAGTEVLEQLGDIARGISNFNEAITYYQRASRDRADVNRARRCTAKLAWCYMKKHLEDLAAETLREITITLDDDPETLQTIMDLLYEIAEMYIENKMFDRAQKVFKQLCKIDAGYRDVLDRVERVRG